MTKLHKEKNQKLIIYYDTVRFCLYQEEEEKYRVPFFNIL